MQQEASEKISFKCPRFPFAIFEALETIPTIGPCFQRCVYLSRSDTECNRADFDLYPSRGIRAASPSMENDALFQTSFAIASPTPLLIGSGIAGLFRTPTASRTFTSSTRFMFVMLKQVRNKHTARVKARHKNTPGSAVDQSNHKHPRLFPPPLFFFFLYLLGERLDRRTMQTYRNWVHVDRLFAKLPVFRAPNYGL